MRIALFGGSYDPPHLGHLAVARTAQHALALDRVLFSPSGRQPLKPAGATASYADRLAMTRLLCAGSPRFEVTELDAPRDDGQPNYTLDSIHRLRATLAAQNELQAKLQAEPQNQLPAELFVLTGIDAFLDLPRWHRPAELLASASWIVVARPGQDVAAVRSMPLAAPHLDRIHILPELAVPLSSSMLRDCLARGEDCAAYLSAPVRDYIAAHHLYQPS